MQNLRLILVDPRAALCEAWSEAFAGLPNVEVVEGVFQDLPAFDCIVTAGNSFGIMDGGIDAAITAYFGTRLMRRVQDAIVDRYLGEQPVGTSMIVETDHETHPFLAHTPTMRIPMPVSRTDYAYVAMWAMLVEISRHNRMSEQAIESIACPGLGTGVGRMPAAEAARQMANAYQHFLSPPTRITWKLAGDRQAAINRGGDLGLVIVKTPS